MKRPGDGEVYCLWIARSGEQCGNMEVAGLEYCVQHVPDDLLEEAEDITGMFRCRYNFGEDDACRQLAVKGTDPIRCKNHGANAGSVQWKQAQHRQVEDKITDIYRQIMNEQGERLLHPERIGDPLIELLELAAEMGEFRTIMREQVAELIKKGNLGYSHTKVGEQLRYQGVLYERALERFAKILLDISKLNIQDRLAGVQEQTAAMLERALDAALEESGVGLDGISGARKAFRRHLKVVQAELVS